MMSLRAATGFVGLGWRRGLGERVLIAVPIVTYALLVAVFSSIFKATPLDELPLQIRVSAPELIWYLILTEMITFTGGYTFQEVRLEVLEGQFAASLARPTSYFAGKIWGWLGQTVLRVLVFFTAGLVLGRFLSGTFLDWRLLPIALVSVTLGAFMHGVVYFSLALLEVWGPYARPALWISQKLCFVFGGLLLPISFYPGWMQDVAWLTPYPAILNVAGRLALAPSRAQLFWGISCQLFWLGLIILLAFGTQYYAERKLLATGT
jgi:ABC-2 type transport system permease protein